MSGAPLAICYGTRPQVIKASMLIEACTTRWPVLTVDTGQHYDYALNELFYEQLGVRKPDHFLEVGSAAHAVQTAHVLTRAAAVFEGAKPRAVVVIGDTNSTLGCALAAVQLRIPMVHVEAGLRSNDRAMAEEINRRVVDSVADLLCAPSAAARAQLELEHQWGVVANTGDIAHDVLRRNLAKAIAPPDVDGWPLARGETFAIATLHRAELTASAASLTAMVGALRTLPLPVVLPAHPRVRDALAKLGLESGGMLHIMSPLGYFEMIGAIRDAAIVITDSGGVQREAYWMGTKCVTIRTETEWHETVALGANTLVSPARAAVDLGTAVEQRLASEGTWNKGAYGAGDAAVKITDAIAAMEQRSE
ncbi:MAG: UDP-N-acetyl glucosamine 2-epimerase [bacterium]